jgi:hypothetical protein
VTFDWAPVIVGDQGPGERASWGESRIIAAASVIKINALTVPSLP